VAEAAGLRGLRFRPGTEQRRGFEDVAALGDLIIGFQGRPIESDIQLFDLIELEVPAAPLAFDVLREGKPHTVVLKPGARTPKPAGPAT
jgi:S1-C subfamily serine protease